MNVIETTGLTKYYGEVRGVEDLSLSVGKGEVFGFLGPNGAGKTTTIRTLMGFQSPTEGTATVLGADITDAAALRDARGRIGYLPSEPGFDENVTGRRLLEYHGSLRGDVRSEELLELFDPPLDRKVGQYSRGNKQMLAIVMAFMHDPDLVVMDEPTSGLDPLKQDQFLEFIRAEQERGKTFFFSSHILSEVRKVCDRIGIIRNGHLVELENVESLLDRTGKVVRANVGGAVTAEEFAIEGAHDVTVSGESAEGAAPVTTESDGGGEDSTTVSFTYTGPYQPLLRHLLNYDLLELAIEEAPLEDIFMRFYGDHDAEAVVERVENGRTDGHDGHEETDSRNAEAADV
ncbi:ABC transporter ATP-binding protein [Halomarina oriensis]|uniref:ATP-binding cassette domain-containing protein n=1 Tax=Halomarina oriensis TaxID=671145 RepID=A0A6B0GFL1_9EURY|nr:ABC transporter ATP-binding protein [Halomarina oriensis]MWG33494.1 ATP-binding cassette domain-containing protein [Halomarina oriensis]